MSKKKINISIENKSNKKSIKEYALYSLPIPTMQDTPTNQRFVGVDYDELCAKQDTAETIYRLINKISNGELSWVEDFGWPGDTDPEEVTYGFGSIRAPIAKLKTPEIIRNLGDEKVDSLVVSVKGQKDIFIGNPDVRCRAAVKANILKGTGGGADRDSTDVKVHDKDWIAPDYRWEKIQSDIQAIKNNLEAMINGEAPGYPELDKSLVCGGLSKVQTNILSNALDYVLPSYAAINLSSAALGNKTKEIAMAAKDRNYKPKKDVPPGSGQPIRRTLKWGTIGALTGWLASWGLDSIESQPLDEEKSTAVGGFLFLHILTKHGLQLGRAGKGIAGAAAAVAAAIKLISQRDHVSYFCAVERMLWAVMLGAGGPFSLALMKNPRIFKILYKTKRTEKDWELGILETARHLVRFSYENAQKINWTKTFRPPGMDEIKGMNQGDPFAVALYAASCNIYRKMTKSGPKNIDYLNPDETIEFTDEWKNALLKEFRQESIAAIDRLERGSLGTVIRAVADSSEFTDAELIKYFQTNFIDRGNQILRDQVVSAWKFLEEARKGINLKEIEEQLAAAKKVAELISMTGKTVNPKKILESVRPILKKAVLEEQEDYIQILYKVTKQIKKEETEGIQKAVDLVMRKVNDLSREPGLTGEDLKTFERIIEKTFRDHWKERGDPGELSSKIRQAVLNEVMKPSMRKRLGVFRTGGGADAYSQVFPGVMWDDKVSNFLSEGFEEIVAHYRKLEQLEDISINLYRTMDTVNLSVVEEFGTILNKTQGKLDNTSTEFLADLQKEANEMVVTRLNQSEEFEMSIKALKQGKNPDALASAGRMSLKAAEISYTGGTGIFNMILKKASKLSPIGIALMGTGGAAMYAGVKAYMLRSARMAEFLNSGTEEEVRIKLFVSRIYFTLAMQKLMSTDPNDIVRSPGRKQKIQDSFKNFEDLIEVPEAGKRIGKVLRQLNPQSISAQQEKAPFTTPSEIFLIKQATLLLIEEYFVKTKKKLKDTDVGDADLKSTLLSEAEEMASKFKSGEELDPWSRAIDSAWNSIFSKYDYTTGRAGQVWKGVSNSEIYLEAIKKDPDLKSAIVESQKAFPNVSISLILALIHTESRFGKSEISRVGAMGYTQVMPKTWRANRSLELSDDPFDTKANIYAGVRTLSNYLKYAAAWVKEFPEIKKVYSIKHLALTGYHTGSGNLVNALRRHANDPVKGYRSLKSVKDNKYADAVLRREEEIYKKTSLYEGITTMNKNDLERLVKEVLNENSGQGYAPYPYGSSVKDEDQPEADYTEEWKAFCSDLVRDISRDTAIEVAKILVKDLELFEDVLDLTGKNQSVGEEILRKIKLAKEKQQNV